jgi:hypothetical protein
MPIYLPALFPDPQALCRDCLSLVEAILRKDAILGDDSRSVQVGVQSAVSAISHYCQDPLVEGSRPVGCVEDTCALLDSCYGVLHAAVTRKFREATFMLPVLVESVHLIFSWLIKISAAIISRHPTRRTSSLTKDGGGLANGLGDGEARLLRCAHNAGRLLEALSNERTLINKVCHRIESDLT